MSDLILSDIASGYNLGKINNNFQAIEDKINDEILHLTGGNNIMQQGLDMNSKPLYNLPRPSTNREPLLLEQLAELASSDIGDATNIVYTDPDGNVSQLDDFLDSVVGRGVLGICGTVADMTGADIALLNGGRLTSTFLATVANSGMTISTKGYYDPTGAGGANYFVKTRAQHRIDIGQPTWVPDGWGDHYLFGGSTYVAILVKQEWWATSQFGARGDGLTDDILPIQAAIDRGGKVLLDGTEHVTSASIELRDTVTISGLADPNVLSRQQSRLLPNGNFPCITNDSGGMVNKMYYIENLEIEYSNITPTVPTGNDQKIGIYFVPKNASPYYAPYCKFENLEINGAWWAFYDDSDNYKHRLIGVRAWHCRNGFYKRLGTMTLFDTCSSSNGEQAFYLNDTVSPTLVNCSGDSNKPVPGVTPGDAVCYFNSCSNVSIVGWDCEGNQLEGTGVSYMHFRDVGCQGTITGLACFANSMSCTTGEWITWIRASSNADVLLNNPNFKAINPATALNFTGNGGDCSICRTDGGGEITLIGGVATAPTGGTPTNRYSLHGVGGDFYVLGGTTLDNTSLRVRFASQGVNTDLTRLRFPNASTGTGTVTADYMDAYEEGTFAASLRAGGTEWKSITASYRRIGDTVKVWVSDENAIYTSGPTGVLTIEGLPYTSRNNDSHKAVGSFVFREVGAGVTRSVHPIIENNDDKIRFFEISGSAPTGSNINAEELFLFNGSTGNYFTVNIEYLI